MRDLKEPALLCNVQAEISPLSVELRGSFVEEERSKNMLGLACECEMSVFSQQIFQLYT